jgi:death-on-curing protein
MKVCLNRPFSGFGETKFYPSPEEKAAAIVESIVKNHPFVEQTDRLRADAFNST